MIEFLYSLDVWLFFFINHTIANPVLDVVLPFMTDLNKFRPAQLMILVWIGYVLWRGGRTGRVTIGLLLITIVISDQLNSSILKDLFGRIRPCRALEGVRMLVDCGGGLSFPSSHAANNFAAATLISSFYPRQKIYWFIFASVMAISRPYVGVHYPSDVIGGAIVGFAIGSMVVFLWRTAEKKLQFLHP